MRHTSTMTKRDFIAMADYLRDCQPYCQPFTPEQIEHLANFCHSRNAAFKCERWLAYIAGTCGPNGGSIRK